jgi:PAS domain S-box-containing protein
MSKRPVAPKTLSPLHERHDPAPGRTTQPMGEMAELQARQLVHELQVHQIELETQNEELRRAHLEIQAARDRYAELYDFSPAGHLTLDSRGVITEANLQAALILHENRNDLIGQSLERFIEPEDQARLCQHKRAILHTGLRQSCELRIRKEGEQVCWVTLESLACRNGSGNITRWQTAMLDISSQERAKQKLLAQERQLEAIIESAMDAIITLDDRHRIMLFNHAAESIFGCPAAEAIGQSLDRFIPERYRQAHEKHLAAFTHRDQDSGMRRPVGELYGRRITGQEFPIEASISHVTVNDRVIMTIMLRDITERKAAEEALQLSEQFTRAVLDSLSAQVCVLDKNGTILETNASWDAVSRNVIEGCQLVGDVGVNYLDICRHAIQEGELAVEPILRGIEAVLAGTQPAFSAEYPCQTPLGQSWYLLRVTQLKGSNSIVLSHIDISERVHMARALEDHVVLLARQQMELESLAGKLLDAQEQERRRIARELHDDFNQRLAVLSVELETMEQALSPSHSPAVAQLAGVRAHVSRLSDDLHDLAYRLHPSLLEHVGLEVAMRDHVAEFTARTGLTVRFTAHDVPDRLGTEVATNLFRVVQESLQNAFKHADASEVTVRLRGSTRGLGLSIRDDGKGFDASSKSAQIKGLGLLSMKERMRVVRGMLRVHSVPGGGTQVCAWVPRSKEAR